MYIIEHYFFRGLLAFVALAAPSGVTVFAAPISITIGDITGTGTTISVAFSGEASVPTAIFYPSAGFSYYDLGGALSADTFDIFGLYKNISTNPFRPGSKIAMSLVTPIIVNNTTSGGSFSIEHLAFINGGVGGSDDFNILGTGVGSISPGDTLSVDGSSDVVLYGGLDAGDFNLSSAGFFSLSGFIIPNSDITLSVQAASAHAPGSAIPEPSTLILFGMGMVGLGGFQWRKKRNQIA